MSQNQFNICPTCSHQSTCVLTKHKNQVWACSEFDEKKTDHSSENNTKEQEGTEPKLEIAYT